MIGRHLAGLLAAALVALVPAAALAANAHFVVGPDTTITDSSATTTGSIAGLGNQDVTIVQTIDVAVTCANPGRNADVPGQRASFSSAVAGLRPENGRVNFEITTTVGDLSGACPNGRWTATGTVVSAAGQVFQGGVLVLSWA